MYLFNRNYGDYSMGKAYPNANVKIEPAEIEKLIKNGTISEVEDEEGTVVKNAKLTMTYVKDNASDVYDKIFAKGSESREAEVTELKKQVEELTAKVTELETK